ncbi:Protein SKT5 [Tolypocladium capitatum]|uniref:Protein SKT5 n=1 Tax=Tolypocladium capitatum TaxID=45235 RepID=A0A2K3QF97_9HYPO|nr:Protein SKT5 [Tolypocladium capitatum]
MSASPGSDSRAHASLHAMSSTVAAVGKVPRKPVPLPQLSAGNARLREAPVSPVRVNFQQDNWAQPSNANIELARPQVAQFHLVDRARDPRSSASAAVPRGSGDEPAAARQELPEPCTASRGPVAAIEFSHAPLELNLSPTSATGPDRYGTTAPSPEDGVRSQDAFRNSRESDETASTTQHPASARSSAATSASSLSGINENAECPPNGESPGSSIIEGNLPPNSSIPQFQYHHNQEQPQRVSSVPSDVARSTLNPELLESAGPIRRHLTPTSGYFRRSSLPRPQSAYSNFSDYGPRGRSPNLMPGGSHMRAPSVQSRKSPDARPSSYAELLNIPYPQQAPAPLSLDNSNLRNAVGNNASLLSTQKTLEMYRQNVKKTNDFTIQYSFAVFLISTAQEQGLDASDPKARKASPQPLRDLDSPVVEGSVAGPYELVREARQILQRLANGGYPFAQYYLADGYASGLFGKGKEDYNSAFPLFVLAAKHGHAESAYRTALCYEFGWGCRKDPVKAVQFLRTAAAKRHPGAMTRLGKACLSGDLGEKRYREGIKWMKLATEAADTQYNAAPYQLGCLYETGYGDDVFQDLNYAAELFTQAADLGHPEANFRMGDAYEHGLLNCPRDPALSVHFYTGAAERGHAAGMMGLCAWYMVGAAPVLEKDEEEAYEWSRRSAELGFVKAQYAVGYFTEMGIGCRRDVLEANVWYVKAADAGDERAKVRLAAIQNAVSGEGTPMDVAPPRNGKVSKAPKDDKECVVM